MYNVYTNYDNTMKVIGRIKPRSGQFGLEISPRTFNRLIAARVIGGMAGIYADTDEPIYVVDRKKGRIITVI